MNVSKCCILFIYTKISLLKWAIQEQKNQQFLEYSPYQNQILQVSLYYVKVSLCKISKANEFWLARYFNIYKSGRSKNKKINSSWNTHPFNSKLCRFLCIMFRYLSVKFQRLMSFGWQDILIYCLNIPKYLYKSGRSKNKKINSSWNTHPYNSRFCKFLCIMFRYLCVKFQRLTSFSWQDILIYIKVGNPRTKKLIVLGILTQSKKGCVHFFVL